MEFHYPRSPRHDLSSRPMLIHMAPGASLPRDDDTEWFFNTKIVPETPRNQLEPIKQRGQKEAQQGLLWTPRDTGTVAKPRLDLTKRRKLAAIKKERTAVDLKKKIEAETTKSIGNSLIFHNIPERHEDTPEEELVHFCQDYLVGRRGINNVRFGEVHKMEQRFSKEGPITARFALVLPPKRDQPDMDSIKPLPWIPAIPKRKLPMLKTKMSGERRRARYKMAN